MKQQYYEGMHGRLVPVKSAKRFKDGNHWMVRAVVSRDNGSYPKGGILRFPPNYLVEKSDKKKGPFLLVRTIPLDDIPLLG